MKTIVCLIGISGSGKGFLTRMLQEKVDLEHISVGDKIRERQKTDAFLVETANKGYLVEDSFIIREIFPLAEKSEKDFVVLDGVPRSVSQLGYVIKWTRDNSFKLVFILLESSDELAKERMLARGREDDNPETIARRIELYHRIVEPLNGIVKQQLADKSLFIDTNVDVKKISNVEVDERMNSIVEFIKKET